MLQTFVREVFASGNVGMPHAHFLSSLSKKG